MLTILISLSANAADYYPSNKTEFQEARNVVQPGDRIILPSGDLDWGQLFFNASGTEEAPITIQAPTVFATTITGSSYLQITGDHIVVKGIKFKNTTANYPMLIDGGTSVRVTQCYFDQSEAPGLIRSEGASLSDLQKASQHVIDHNFISNTNAGGVSLVSPASSDFAGNILVEHNVFRDARRSSNGGAEAMNLYSEGKHEGHQQKSTVRYNVFDNWDADADREIITVKSGGNQFYGNVFAWCLGYFSFRRENNNTLDSNYFYSNDSGIWVYGEDHTIINNVFEDCRSNGLQMTQGWLRESDGIEGRAPKNNLVANNTWINTGSPSFLFTTTGQGFVENPSGNRIINNVIYASSTSGILVDDRIGFHSANIVDNNLYFTTSGSTGPTGTNPLLSDPLLTGSGYSVHLGNGSPAIDAGLAEEKVAFDFFGNARTSPIDIGHHEYSASASPNITAELPPIPPNRSTFSTLPLEASFTAYPLEVEVGEALNLDASISKGPIVSYKWELDDGHMYEGPEAFYPYDWNSAGEKQVTLTVEDGTGATHTTSLTVTVVASGPDPDGWLNTGAWLGWVNQANDPWWWVESMGRYVYVPDQSGWIYFKK